MSRGLYRQECCIIRGDDSIILGIMGNAMVGALQITFHSPRDVPSSCGTKEVKLRKSIYSQAKISVVSSKRSFHFKRKKNESHYVKFKNQQIFLYPKQMARFKNNFTPVTSFYALSLRSGEWNGNPEHHCWNLISTLEEFFSHLHHKLSQEILRLPVKILTV